MRKDNQLCFELSQEDIECIKHSYSSWELSQNESPIDFIEKKKSIDLVYLLNDVIETELNNDEKYIVKLFYFQGKPISKIANELGLHRSTACRKLDTINNKIYKSLKYAVMYKYQHKNADIIPLAIRETFTLCAIKASSPNSIGGRILKLRTLAMISIECLSNCLNISCSRLQALETGHCDITTNEVVFISSFFNVSTDYLLTGKTKKE